MTLTIRHKNNRAWVEYKLAAAGWYLDALSDLEARTGELSRLVGEEMALDGALVGIASALGMSVLGTMLGMKHAVGGPGAAMLASAGVLVAIIMFVFASLSGLLGYGMWNLRDWARIVTMVLAGLGAIGAALGFFFALAHMNVFGLALTVIRLGINVAILWYLNLPEVSRAFSQPRLDSSRAAV